MGDPIKIPVYRGNTKVDLIFYLFTRIGICDGPAREKLGQLSGANANHGCGSCLAEAQSIQSYKRYVNTDCVGKKIEWGNLLDTFQNIQGMSNEQFMNHFTSEINPYFLYDHP